ncbi:MAG: hypothetical protein E7568_05705 [Ruminococcaceae bacterium]|nr:hypothetical protein [Oscillospiraceae bacterium]
MQNKNRITLAETCIFAMLGALMFCSKILMEILPNIHLLGMFTMVFAVTFRKNGLIPIYVYVLINGVYCGFATWWYAYLYIWTVLWGMTMLIPKNLPFRIKSVIYPVVCGLHGILFGILYAPAQALFYGFDFKETIAWIIAGFPFDITHAISNIFAGMLVLPLSNLLTKITKEQ